MLPILHEMTARAIEAERDARRAAATGGRVGRRRLLASVTWRRHPSAARGRGD